MLDKTDYMVKVKNKIYNPIQVTKDKMLLFSKYYIKDYPRLDRMFEILDVNKKAWFNEKNVTEKKKLWLKLGRIKRMIKGYIKGRYIPIRYKELVKGENNGN